MAILAYLVFGDRISSASHFFGILVAIAGTAAIASDGSVVSATFSGNTLVVIGDITVALYVLSAARCVLPAWASYHISK